MGAWGPALFSDDVACDVRDAYRERLANGMAGPAATEQLLADWKVLSMPEDDDDVMIFWMALAATQWKAGRLEDGVKDKAIAIIDSGKDLERWEDVKQGEKRRAVLQKLKEQLLSPQPAANKVHVQRFYVPPWSCGDYVTYRLNSGQLVILSVEDVHFNAVECSILDWVGTDVPDDATILALPKRVSDFTPSGLIDLITAKKKAIPYDRLTVLNLKRPSAKPPKASEGSVVWFWESLDYQLEDTFQLK